MKKSITKNNFKKKSIRKTKNNQNRGGAFGSKTVSKSVMPLAQTNNSVMVPSNNGKSLFRVPYSHGKEPQRTVSRVSQGSTVFEIPYEVAKSSSNTKSNKKKQSPRYTSLGPHTQHYLEPAANANLNYASLQKALSSGD